MKDQMERRLNHLKAEYDAGKKVIAELESKQANLRDTLLRISGAIQVLEETLAEFDGEGSAANVSTESTDADSSSVELKAPKSSDSIQRFPAG